MINRNKCPGCKGYKATRWLICSDCQDKYGRYADWPKWLKAKVLSELREQYAERRGRKYESPLREDVPALDQDGNPIPPDVIDDLYTRPMGEMAVSFCEDDMEGDMAMPYSPYDDEGANRQYRLANGIKEREMSRA